jgi:hypothetical protein
MAVHRRGGEEEAADREQGSLRADRNWPGIAHKAEAAMENSLDAAAQETDMPRARRVDSPALNCCHSCCCLQKYRLGGCIATACARTVVDCIEAAKEAAADTDAGSPPKEIHRTVFELAAQCIVWQQ